MIWIYKIPHHIKYQQFQHNSAATQKKKKNQQKKQTNWTSYADLSKTKGNVPFFQGPFLLSCKISSLSVCHLWHNVKFQPKKETKNTHTFYSHIHFIEYTQSIAQLKREQNQNTPSPSRKKNLEKQLSDRTKQKRKEILEKRTKKKKSKENCSPNEYEHKIQYIS